MTKTTVSTGSGSSRRKSESPGQLDRVTELGATIVRSFEREGDRLSQWMAHRLAELLDAAEAGRTQAQREAAAEQATDLILRLWQQRREWPRGWPPGEWGTLLERLQELETTPTWQRRFSPPSNVPPDWASALTELNRIEIAERHIVMSAALVSMDAKEIEDWATASAKAGELDELIDQLERNVEAARRALTERPDPRLSGGEDEPDVSPMALQENAMTQLAELAERRAEMLRALSDAIGLSVKAPRKRASSGKGRARKVRVQTEKGRPSS